VENQPSKIKILEIFFPIFILTVSAIAVRFFSSKDYHQILTSALAIGSIFNILSFITVGVAAIQRRRSSGVSFVSIVCYFWFLVASNYALISIHETRWQWILLFKPIDAILLWSFTYLCNFPARFQPSSRTDL
jgi:hypothetical protein